MSDEQVVKPDRIGSMDPAVTKWKPPSNHTILFARRVFQIQGWIQSQHRFVEEEEIMTYTMRHFDLDREQARKYLKVVVDEFKNAGIRVIDQS